MSLFTVQDLDELARQPGGWCVSIYLPTIKAGAQTRQNRIRFKNLLNEAEKQLQTVEMDGTNLEKFLDPAYTLEKDPLFWQEQDQGLAVFISKNGLRSFRLPIEVNEAMVVNSHFYIKPLLQLLYEGGEFYILALSQNEVRLLKGTPYEVQEMDLEEIPPSLAEALKFDTFDYAAQFHTETIDPIGPDAGGEVIGGQRPAIYHGKGEHNDKKTRLKRYFQKIDKGLSDMLKDRQSPLVLAGVEYLMPIYKEANSYKNLLSKGITGNPEEIKNVELHDQAWKIIQSVFKDAQRETTQRYLQLNAWNDKQATSDVEEVIKAAPYARVQVLFLDKNASRWGTFDRQNNQIHFDESPKPENQDLIDFAAVQTLLNGGTVYAVEPEDVPGGGQVAAILRF